MENIIMVDTLSNFWAAVIDENAVLYFTNKKENAGHLPGTIQNWRKNFEEYPVKYHTPAE